MSLSGLETVTGRFLSRPDPEVLCIRGAWGIGKTYAWKQAVDRARNARTLPLEGYAYASLFGINSLEELKQAIFDNSVGKKNAGLDASVATFEEFVETSKSFGKQFLSLAELAAQKVSSAAAHTGVFSKFLGNIAPGLFLSVRERIVCIDDIERRGEKLRVGEVLGFISMLKEQRRCKVVLLLNDQAIDESGKKDFEAYLEKVVDISFHFNPTPEDSIRIAFPDRSGVLGKTANACVKVGLRNIRILWKIARFVEDIRPILENFDASIIDQAINTVVLLCWVVYDPTNAPSIEYLQTRDPWHIRSEERSEDLTPQMLAWNATLQSYGFGTLDELDNALLDGIRNGLFDEEQIGRVAKDLHASAIARNEEKAFHDAWAPYHDSFDVDQETFLDGLYKSFKAHCRYISPVSVNGTVVLFKELGRSEQAADLIRLFADTVEDPKLIDMTEYFWASEIKDPDVIAAFNARHQQLVPPPDPAAVFLQLIDKQQYNTYSMTVVAQLSSAAIATILLSLKGEGFRKACAWISSLGTVSYGDEQANIVKARVETLLFDALQSIASRNAISQRRVSALVKRLTRNDANSQ